MYMLIQSSYRSLWLIHPLKFLEGPRKCWAAKSLEQKWKENNSFTQIKTQTSRTVVAPHTSTPMGDGTEAVLWLSLEREVMVSETAQKSPLQNLTGLRCGDFLKQYISFGYVTAEKEHSVTLWRPETVRAQSPWLVYKDQRMSCETCLRYIYNTYF